MGRSWFDVRAIWHFGPINLVGIFMGYHGAGHLFRYLWHRNGRIRLLLSHQTGKCIDAIEFFFFKFGCHPANRDNYAFFNLTFCFYIL